MARSSPFTALLERLTRLVVSFPALTLAIAVAVAVVSVAFACTRLGFRTSRLDLLNPHSSHNRLWIDYVQEFGSEDDVVVVVEGNNRESVIPVLDAISTALHDNRLFKSVMHKVDLSNIQRKGLHYLPPAELRQIDSFLQDATPILQGNWECLKLSNMVRGLCFGNQGAPVVLTPASQAAIEARSSRWLQSLAAALDQPGRYESPWPVMPGVAAAFGKLNTQHLLAKEGRMGFVLLQLNGKSEGSLAQNTEGLDALRRSIAQVQAQYPQTKIGITGLPVMENDEMTTSQSAMTLATLLSLAGVAGVFVVGFGGLRHPLMAVATLLLGMAWSFGYITLVVGHLNILSIAFGAVVIGLGIDFGIHYVARYLQLRPKARSVETALVEAATGVGPGIVTGAATTAIAFFVAGFTEFTGVAELGIIAGGGILLCCLAAVTALPAMIYFFDRNRDRHTMPAPLDMQAQLKRFNIRPLAALFFGVVLILEMSPGLSRLWYDHNLLNLQAEGTESVELEQKLLSEMNQSAWFAVSIGDDRQELLARKARFLQLPSVERVEEIISLLPDDAGAKSPIIAGIQRRIGTLPDRIPQISADTPDGLDHALGQVQAMLAGNSGASQLVRQVENIRTAMRKLPAAECNQRLWAYQQQMATDFLKHLWLLRSVSNPEPPRTADLPNALVSRFVGKNGRHLLQVYSKGSIWDMAAMEKFVREVRSVDPRATGNPLQTYEASWEMKRSYEQAGLYALFGILAFVYFDFRSLRYTLLAVLPLGLGMLQTLSLLGVARIPLNPANMIVLPLLLGIGVDNGVHLVHDFREQKGCYRMSPSIASSVLLTSLTTMVGFGSLMIASHRGLQSLGRVLVIGVACCLFTSLVILPALLSWLSRHRPPTTADEHLLNTQASGCHSLERIDAKHPSPTDGHMRKRRSKQVAWKCNSPQLSPQRSMTPADHE